MGVWIEIPVQTPSGPICSVTPLVGVWIEICWIISIAASALSLPLWECGLKSDVSNNVNRFVSVTPLVGVWIEITQHGNNFLILCVTPLVGVWIEIFFRCQLSCRFLVTPLVGVWIEIKCSCE